MTLANPRTKQTWTGFPRKWRREAESPGYKCYIKVLRTHRGLGHVFFMHNIRVGKYHWYRRHMIPRRWS